MVSLVSLSLVDRANANAPENRLPQRDATCGEARRNEGLKTAQAFELCVALKTQKI